MYYFIINEHSGRGRAGKEWLRLKQPLEKEAVPFKAWITRGVGDATALAEHVCTLTDEEIRLVVVGGDGTINEVLNGICDFERVVLGVLPVGSGNDFARGLGLPHRVDEAMRRLYEATGASRIDLGTVCVDGTEKRRFGISAGVGLDAKVCEQVDASKQKSLLNRIGLGSLAYGIMTLSVVAHMEWARGNVVATTENGEVSFDFEKLLFLSAMNFPWEGGGVPIAPDASGEDGWLSMCMASELSKAKAFMCLPRLAKGHHYGVNGVHHAEARRIEVKVEKPLVVHADGEILGYGTEICFEVLPQALRVLI